jgi:hypothetical protein
MKWSGGCDGQDLSSTGREKAVIKSGGIQQLEHTPPPRHPGNPPEGTVRAIIKQAGLSIDEFLEL